MGNKKNKPKVKCFFDKETNTASYIVIDESTKKCAIFDSVLDFDYFSGKISYTNAEKLIQFIIRNKLELQWLNETHIHADHLSAAPYIKNKLGGNIGISSEIIQLQEIFGKVPTAQRICSFAPVLSLPKHVFFKVSRTIRTKNSRPIALPR